jgi:hypothetical protein
LTLREGVGDEGEVKLLFSTGFLSSSLLFLHPSFIFTVD